LIKEETLNKVIDEGGFAGWSVAFLLAWSREGIKVLLSKDADGKVLATKLDAAALNAVIKNGYYAGESVASLLAGSDEGKNILVLVGNRFKYLIAFTIGAGLALPAGIALYSIGILAGAGIWGSVALTAILGFFCYKADIKNHSKEGVHTPAKANAGNQHDNKANGSTIKKIVCSDEKRPALILSTTIRKESANAKEQPKQLPTVNRRPVI